MTFTAVRGTALGATDFSEFENPDQRYRVRGEDDFVPIPRDQWASRRLEDIVDGILYTGRDRTSSGDLAEALCRSRLRQDADRSDHPDRPAAGTGGRREARVQRAVAA